MRAALLYGPGDLRVEEVPRPAPGSGELLIRVEACGVCPTDIRKFRLGADGYPLNAGHEWVGRVHAVGAGANGWRIGDRIYGDTYAGYAEYATIAVEPEPWSAGPIRLPEDLPLETAVFLEPLADCLHAVHDRANVGPGNRVAVVGAGQMGLQLCAAASLAGAEVLAVDRLDERRRLARDLGATDATETLPSGPFDAVILSIPAVALVQPALDALRPGGRLVLFAGFTGGERAGLDLNLIHYRELVLTGSEWVGTPPNQRRDWYARSLELLVRERVPVERLVTDRCDLDGLPAAFESVAALRSLKTVMLFP